MAPLAPSLLGCNNKLEYSPATSPNAETSTQHAQGFCCHMFAEVARRFLPVLVECLCYRVEERIQIQKHFALSRRSLTTITTLLPATTKTRKTPCAVPVLPNAASVKER